jgi:hypothetical protein
MRPRYAALTSATVAVDGSATPSTSHGVSPARVRSSSGGGAGGGGGGGSSSADALSESLAPTRTDRVWNARWHGWERRLLRWSARAPWAPPAPTVNRGLDLDILLSGEHEGWSRVTPGHEAAAAAADVDTADAAQASAAQDISRACAAVACARQWRSRTDNWQPVEGAYHRAVSSRGLIGWSPWLTIDGGPGATIWQRDACKAEKAEAQHNTANRPSLDNGEPLPRLGTCQS